MFVQLQPGSGFVTACAILLNILISSSTATSPIPPPSISNSVASHICKQQSAFTESGEIQTPVTAKPENDDATCGWYIWQECEDAKSNSESETCPTFVLEACADLQIQKTGRRAKGKGKGISLQLNPAEQGQDNTTCANSTEQGLPNPQLVPSAAKYPWIVTISQGERCKDKLCTGLIVNENWVVVMQAGCMYTWPGEKHPDYFDVVAGEMKLFAEEETEQRRQVAQYIPHPGPEPEKFHFYKDNIGLVRVSAPFEFNENVQPIDLEAIEAMAPSIEKSVLTIVGWTREPPMKEEELLISLIEAQLDYNPMEECYDKLMEGDNATIDTLICAGQCPFYGNDSNQPLRNVLFAQADSNSPPVPVGLGPLKHFDITVQHFVFVNIASYIPWIKENLEGQGQGQVQDETTQSPESESESRIVNGEEAPRFKYKSIVNLETFRSYACTGHICGGSILSEEWFLTAAHCVDGVDPADYKVFVGDHDVTDEDENEQNVAVVKIIVHEDYDGYTDLNDIAVLKVTPPFKFNDKVQKATLPSDLSFQPTGPLTAAGWGLTELIVGSHILKQVQVDPVPLEDCQKGWANSNKKVGENQICAGNETHGICKGDSGGPLYHIDESGDQILVGLTSLIGTPCKQTETGQTDPYGRRAAEPEPEPAVFKPAVFTRITAYLEWIRKNAEL